MSADDQVGWADTMAAVLGPSRSEGERSPPPAPITGEGRYEYVEELGAGGMGRVIVARDHQFGRCVALKLLGDHVQDASHARRFVAEAVITGRLEHSGIPAVYERGVRDGRPFYAMRRVEGRTLSEAMKGARTLADRLALLPAVVQVAHTVGFAHTQGVIHRDVKPANIVLGEHGEVVLVDWGIAKVIGLEADEPTLPAVDGGTAAETLDGEVLGTPAYMAPEQARGDVSKIDERTDVFALGALLYHLLGGRPPFGGETASAALVAAIESKPTPISELAPDVPEALRAIVERAMAPARSERHEDALLVARALEAFVTGQLVAPPSRTMDVVATIAASLAVGVLVAGLAVTLITGPSLLDLGIPIWAVAAFAAVGATLGLVELRTGGRHDLSSLVVAFAICTLLIAILDSVLGLASLASLMASEPSRQVPFDGLALGILPIAPGTLLCAIQLMLWAVGRRQVARAKRV